MVPGHGFRTGSSTLPHLHHPPSSAPHRPPRVMRRLVPGASLAQDQLFMLRESGALDYSNNGGSSWSMRGNLPVPLGTNSTRYTGISIDLASNIWVVTNTGYCFESTDGATTFTYKGRVPSTPVAGIVTPIPEFGLVPAIIVATLTLAELGRRRRRRT